MDHMHHMTNTSMSTTTMMNHDHMGDNMAGDMMSGHNHGSGDPNATDASCQGGMMMYFHTGNCEFILFEELRTSNVGEMVGACIAIFVLALLYEGLKVLREYLLRRALIGNKYASKGSNSSSQDTFVIGPKQPAKRFDTIDNKVAMDTEYDENCSWIHMLSGVHFVQTLLHMLQVFISYCLMLVFMTYNAWLCTAIIAGAGLGYFLFGWTKSIVVDMNEHCH